MRHDRDDELLDKQLKSVGESLAGAVRTDEMRSYTSLTSADQGALKDSEDGDGGKHRQEK